MNRRDFLKTGAGVLGTFVMADHLFVSGSARRLAEAAPTDSKGAPNGKERDMEKIKIQFTLFSAFYSPLISTMSGGFLKAEGLAPEWSVAPPGVSALAALKDGS